MFPSHLSSSLFLHLSISIYFLFSFLLLSPSHLLFPPSFLHPLSLSLPLSFLPRGHVTALHDYWRNHSCNSLPSFRWGLLYLSLSLPQVLRHCLGNCMCKARDACDPLRQGSQRREGAHRRGGEEKAKKNWKGGKKTAVWCVLLCVPARAINNCDKFFVARESPWLCLLFQRLLSGAEMLPNSPHPLPDDRWHGEANDNGIDF